MIVALDAPSLAEAEALVERIGDAANFYKIGMELVYAGGGLDLVGRLAAAGKRVFLDLKLHDIPNTVARATARLAESGATFLTVHAYPQTMAAAQSAVAGGSLKLLGVSVLTSMDEHDLARAGYAPGLADLVRLRARQAAEIGLAGLVCSPTDLANVRTETGPRLTLVTPGIRPATAASGDQKRIATPAQAIQAGADHLVIGRPITEAGDPRAAARAILAEITDALTPV
jgi:orotidine-5'-phosphate decarboxylase